ncbi:acetyl-CoA acetyltransferase [Ignicoccus islandicus DSM 13165]|uniref:Acetyl-CoA acetyltransferase n=1 Tax=Ignicoccus islandicus DSM 13165 TaxID=940295 RepID=A0A0U3DVD3_9CREN|nr:thiolase family protein [Ignicoccus islandicus]ALU11386.1 acetyl-CoA acetyltransferase [Ignicoccus islandicus DSM 13165]
MSDVYVVSAVRTPIGKFLGAFSNVPAPDLAAIAVKEAIRRAGIEPKDVNYYTMGNVIGAAVGQNPARRTALLAGIPHHIDGFTINMVCSSGMMSVIDAVRAIKLGEARIALAGGMENMTRAPLCLPQEARTGMKHLIGRQANLIDTMVLDGLTDAWNWRIMGEEADATAKKYGAKREELDEIAFNSHMRAAKATDDGIFKNEIVPVEVKTRKGVVVVDKDEGIRRDTSIEKLSKLPPAFTPDGVHTAGNSSQLSDGAAALILAPEKVVNEYGLKPLARILGYDIVGLKPEDFVEAPVPGIRRISEKLGVKPDDWDLYEVNEAFAISLWLPHHLLGIPYERMNVHGGAIALGHPLGASGARIIVTLINALKTHGQNRGVATLCHGTGGGTTIALELV